MEKIIKKGLSIILLFSMMLSCFSQKIVLVNAAEEYENIALNKPVITSSVRPARSELVGALAVDGIDDDESSR